MEVKVEVKVEDKMDKCDAYNVVDKCIVPFNSPFYSLFYSPFYSLFNSLLIFNYRTPYFLSSPNTCICTQNIEQ